MSLYGGLTGAHVTLPASEMMKNIYCESAQQLLNAVCNSTDPPGSTMLPDLDEFLLRNRGVGSSVESSLNRGDVIEVQGPAASGKTQFLYHLAARCILPKEVLVVSESDARTGRTVCLGGSCRSAVVLDCDGRWDTRRLYNILVTRLNLVFSELQLPPLQDEPQKTVRSIALESLTRLHVFRPASSFQLAATLLNLPKYHAENMPDEEIRILFVDSISAFYWPDRWQAEPSGSKKTHRSNPLGHVLRYLQAFRLSHGPVIVLTNWGLNPLPSTTSLTSSTPFFKQHLVPFLAPFDGPPRQHLSGQLKSMPITCHITLPFPFVPPLLLDASDSDALAGHGGKGLEDALRDERRKEVVHRGEIGGYVRIPRTGRGQDLASGSAVGRFRFRVLECHDVVAA